MLKFTSVMLNTENLKQLVAFYSQVFEKEPDWQEEGYAGFESGGVHLLLGLHDHIQGQSREPDRILFNLETSDVRSEFKRLKSIASKVVAEPYDLEVGDDHGTIATLADPDGNYFQLTTPWKM